MGVRSDRCFRFDREPASVWDAIGRVDEYREWWPWLRHFDARGLFEGDRWDCTVSPPLPYELRFTVALLEVDRPERLVAVVAGDIEGDATITIRPTEVGCDLRLVSDLEPRAGSLLGLTRLMPWLGHYGHDWVLDRGLRQFNDRAL